MQYPKEFLEDFDAKPEDLEYYKGKTQEFLDDFETTKDDIKAVYGFDVDSVFSPTPPKAAPTPPKPQPPVEEKGLLGRLGDVIQGEADRAYIIRQRAYQKKMARYKRELEQWQRSGGVGPRGSGHVPAPTPPEAPKDTELTFTADQLMGGIRIPARLATEVLSSDLPGVINPLNMPGIGNLLNKVRGRFTTEEARQRSGGTNDEYDSDRAVRAQMDLNREQALEDMWGDGRSAGQSLVDAVKGLPQALTTKEGLKALAFEATDPGTALATMGAGSLVGSAARGASVASKLGTAAGRIGLETMAGTAATDQEVTSANIISQLPATLLMEGGAAAVGRAAKGAMRGVERLRAARKGKGVAIPEAARVAPEKPTTGGKSWTSQPIPETRRKMIESTRALDERLNTEFTVDPAQPMTPDQVRDLFIRVDQAVREHTAANPMDPKYAAEAVNNTMDRLVADWDKTWKMEDGTDWKVGKDDVRRSYGIGPARVEPVKSTASTAAPEAPKPLNRRDFSNLVQSFRRQIEVDPEVARTQLSERTDLSERQRNNLESILSTETQKRKVQDALASTEDMGINERIAALQEELNRTTDTKARNRLKSVIKSTEAAKATAELKNRKATADELANDGDFDTAIEVAPDDYKAKVSRRRDKADADVRDQQAKIRGSRSLLTEGDINGAKKVYEARYGVEEGRKRLLADNPQLRERNGLIEDARIDDAVALVEMAQDAARQGDLSGVESLRPDADALGVTRQVESARSTAKNKKSAAERANISAKIRGAIRGGNWEAATQMAGGDAAFVKQVAEARIKAEEGVYGRGGSPEAPAPMTSIPAKIKNATGLINGERIAKYLDAYVGLYGAEEGLKRMLAENPRLKMERGQIRDASRTARDSRSREAQKTTTDANGKPKNVTQRMADYTEMVRNGLIGNKEDAVRFAELVFTPDVMAREPGLGGIGPDGKTMAETAAKVKQAEAVALAERIMNPQPASATPSMETLQSSALAGAAALGGVLPPEVTIASLATIGLGTAATLAYRNRAAIARMAMNGWKGLVDAVHRVPGVTKAVNKLKSIGGLMSMGSSDIKTIYNRADKHGTPAQKEAAFELSRMLTRIPGLTDVRTSRLYSMIDNMPQVKEDRIIGLMQGTLKPENANEVAVVNTIRSVLDETHRFAVEAARQHGLPDPPYRENYFPRRYSDRISAARNEAIKDLGWTTENKLDAPEDSAAKVAEEDLMRAMEEGLIVDPTMGTVTPVDGAVEAVVTMGRWLQDHVDNGTFKTFQEAMQDVARKGVATLLPDLVEQRGGAKTNHGVMKDPSLSEERKLPNMSQVFYADNPFGALKSAVYHQTRAAALVSFLGDEGGTGIRDRLEELTKPGKNGRPLYTKSDLGIASDGTAISGPHPFANMLDWASGRTTPGENPVLSRVKSALNILLLRSNVESGLRQVVDAAGGWHSFGAKYTGKNALEMGKWSVDRFRKGKLAERRARGRESDASVSPRSRVQRSANKWNALPMDSATNMTDAAAAETAIEGLLKDLVMRRDYAVLEPYMTRGEMEWLRENWDVDDEAANAIKLGFAAERKGETSGYAHSGNIPYLLRTSSAANMLTMFTRTPESQFLARLAEMRNPRTTMSKNAIVRYGGEFARIISSSLIRMSSGARSNEAMMAYLLATGGLAQIATYGLGELTMSREDEEAIKRDTEIRVKRMMGGFQEDGLMPKLGSAMRMTALGASPVLGGALDLMGRSLYSAKGEFTPPIAPPMGALGATADIMQMAKDRGLYAAMMNTMSPARRYAVGKNLGEPSIPGLNEEFRVDPAMPERVVRDAARKQAKYQNLAPLPLLPLRF